MRGNVPAFDLWVPDSLEHALESLRDEPQRARPFAGGTDLMVLLEAGVLSPGRYMSILNLEELKGVQVDDEFVTIGALTTYAEIREHGLLGEEFPLLGEAARETGALAIQSRGTLGGNIINASPAADSPPALLVYGAELELVSLGNTRVVAYDNFHTGYKQMDRQPNELLKSIRLPRPRMPRRSYYKKVGARKAQAISKICLASVAQMKGATILDIKLAFASVAPIPLRCTRTEEFLRGEEITAELLTGARQSVLTEISPIDDIRSTTDYRRRVSANLLEDWLKTLRG